MADPQILVGKNIETFFIKPSRNILFLIFQLRTLKDYYNISPMQRPNANFYSTEMNLYLYPPMISA